MQLFIHKKTAVTIADNSRSPFIYQSQAFTRPTYEPSRVSISIISSWLMNKGTRTVAPVSTVAGLVALVAVSPFNPGSV